MELAVLHQINIIDRELKKPNLNAQLRSNYITLLQQANGHLTQIRSRPKHAADNSELLNIFRRHRRDFPTFMDPQSNGSLAALYQNSAQFTNGIPIPRRNNIEQIISLESGTFSLRKQV
jgi:hypothetical protein